MEVLALIFFLACLIMIGMGVVIGVVAVAAVALLVALGVASSSAAVGIARKSAGAGFLSLALQVGGALGLIAGPTVAWMVAAILYDAPFSPAPILCAGAAGGLVAGVTVGWLIYFAASTMARWLWDRVEIRPRSGGKG